MRVVVREVIPGAAVPVPVVHRELRIGEQLTLGREADLPIGVEVPDPGISRAALTVVASDDRWLLHVGNRNGAMLHGWARSPEWLTNDAKQTVRWPRLGVRLIGNDHAVEHWVLLEADGYRIPLVDSPSNGTPSADDTQLPARPREITRNQLAAVYATFPSHLAWPPVVGPVARSLEAVAHRLGVTPSAVRERLRPVQERARELGLTEAFGVTEPEYVYHLAAHGYLTDVPPVFDPAG